MQPNRHSDYWSSRTQALENSIIDINVIGSRILRAMRNREGLSLIRLGDTELLILAQDIAFSTAKDITSWGNCMAALCGDSRMGNGDNEVSKWKNILSRSGVGYPDHQAQELLISAIKSADIVGVPRKKRPGRTTAHARLVGGFQAAMLTCFDRIGLNERNLTLVDNGAHYLLHESGWCRRLLGLDRTPLSQRLSFRIALIGNRAVEYSHMLKANNVEVASIITPVRGVENIDEVMAQINPDKFDIAFVSAGTAAKYICTTIANRHAKVAIDAGQLFDHMLKRYNGSMSTSKYVVPWKLML